MTTERSVCLACGEYQDQCRCVEVVRDLRSALSAAQAELERVTSALSQANAEFEKYERLWYLRGDELERVKEQVRWRPEIVCLCGSTRFMEAFQAANLKETLAGRIVLSVGCNTKADADIFKLYDYEDMIGLKGMLDELHKRKIDLSDEVMVLNVGGYIGESTRSEIQYAEANRKPVRYLEPLPEPPKGEQT